MMDSSHYDHTLPNEDVKVMGPDGELICVVLRNVFDLKELKYYWPIIRKMNMKTENRGTASGAVAVPRIKQDGTKSRTTRVPKGFEAISGVIGYYPRYPRIPFCRQCAWNQEHPEEFSRLLPMFKRVNDLHQEHAPYSWELQNEWAQKTSKDFIIPGTIYTTVTVNKNFRTAAHLDAKNLREGMAPMLLMRSGQFTGGKVVLPEWRTAVNLGQGDLIIFRNMIDYHGNTPINPITEKYTRCTLVFYYREEMYKCGTAAQELERAKSGENFSANLNEKWS